MQQDDHEPLITRENCPTPWVDWFVASIRQGLTWLSYVYSPQANRYRSFTTSALNSITSPKDINSSRNKHLLDRLNIVNIVRNSSLM